MCVYISLFTSCLCAASCVINDDDDDDDNDYLPNNRPASATSIIWLDFTSKLCYGKRCLVASPDIHRFQLAVGVNADRVIRRALGGITSDVVDSASQSRTPVAFVDVKHRSVAETIGNSDLQLGCDHLAVQFADVEAIDVGVVSMHVEYDLEVDGRRTDITVPRDDLLGVLPYHSSNDKTIIPLSIDARFHIVSHIQTPATLVGFYYNFISLTGRFL